MNTYTAELIVIYGNKQHTLFMQACDVFSQDKVLGNIEQVKIEFLCKNKFKIADGNTIVDNVIKALRENKNNIISLVHLVSVKDKNIKFLNNNIVKPYINKEVRQISNGRNFFMFADYLRKQEIEIETDEHNFIV